MYYYLCIQEASVLKLIFVYEIVNENQRRGVTGELIDEQKDAIYAAAGVKEYWIIDCDERTVEQYLIRDGETKYHLARKLTDGEIESVVVCGFRIPVAALFDAKQNQLALQNILNLT